MIFGINNQQLRKKVTEIDFFWRNVLGLNKAKKSPESAKMAQKSIFVVLNRNLTHWRVLFYA